MTNKITTKADLVPYTEDFLTTVHSWIDSEETYQFVCRGKDFPPDSNIVKTWQRKGIHSYLLFADGKPIAYGELWERPNELAVELGHILVAPAKRDKGFGKKIIELLFNRAASRDDVAKVIVRLYHEDEIILRALVAEQFEISGTNTYTEGLRLVRMIT